jgi:DNA ligase (NAD+)
LTKRTGKEKPFQYPKVCPECNSKLMKEVTGGNEEGAAWYCPNSDCPAQVRGHLEHWCARGAMDIEGGGEVLVLQLVSSGLVRDVAELYSLKLAEVANLERMGTKSAQNFLDGVTASKANRATRGACFTGWASFTWARARPNRCANISPHSMIFSARARSN